MESGVFQAHRRRRRLLRHLVEETLAGRADSLRGVAIAMSVFERDETFDHKTDPIVRLEARRLRSDLDSYYATAGRNDPIRISVPKGGYVPDFQWQTIERPEPAPSPSAESPGPLTGPASRSRLLALGGGLIAALAALALGWQLLAPTGENAGSTAAADDPLLALPRGPSIAVLPFLNVSGDADKQYLSDGVTEQLTTELARFRELWVMPFGTMQRYKGGLADPRELHREFGIDYVLEGSVRATPESVRITSRLIDAEHARYVWVKSFNEPFTPASIYEVQDAIAEEVAGNLAGEYGVLAQDSMKLSKRKAPESLDAYDCVLRYYDYQLAISPEQHEEVKACLERAVALEPTFAEAWAVLSNVYMQERRFWGDGKADAEEITAKAERAARRAIEFDPDNPTGHMMLSNLLFTEGDLEGFRESGQAALRLNPNSSDALAHYGLRLSLIGDWERGLALLDKAMTLNPVHPHWYRFAQVVHHYDREEYELALATLDKIEMPTFFWTHLLRAAALGQLRRKDEAQTAVQNLLELKPQFPQEALRRMKVWQLPGPLQDRLVEGLARAGLEVAAGPSEQAGNIKAPAQTD